MPLQNIGTLLVELLLDDSGVTKGTASAKRKLSAFGQYLQGAATQIDQSITSALNRAGAAAAALVTAAAVVGSSFEQEMKKVQAISGGTTEDLKRLEAEARRIGETTTFSATDAAKGMQALAQAGFKTEEIIAATADAMALAGATGIDLNQATMLVAATLTQFNLGAGEAGRVADVFTTAAQNSLLSVEDLAVAFRYAGTSGASFKMTLEETSAAVAQFRDLGLSASQSGTAFRDSLVRIAAPARAGRKVLKDLGVQLEEVNPELVGWEAALRRLAKTQMTAIQGVQLFGKHYGANITMLIDKFREGKSTYNELLERFQIGNGAAARTFAEMSDTIRGAWDQVTSAAEEGLIRIFESMREPLERLLKGIESRLKLLNNLVTENGKTWTDTFNLLVDGALAFTDAVIRLLPYLKEMGLLMLTALVGVKTTNFVVAVVQLGGALGLDLAGGITKVTASLKAMTVVGRAFTVTAIGAIAVAIVSLGAALAQMAFQLTGAAREARELDGALKAVAAHDKETQAREAEYAKLLKNQQGMIELRARVGAELSTEEKALFRLNAEQAYALVLSGELIRVGDKLHMASMQSVDARRTEIGVLDQQVKEFENLSKVSGELLAKWSTSPVGFTEGLPIGPGAAEMLGIDVFDRMERGLNADVLEQAQKILGKNVQSMEDLAEAQRLFKLRADESRTTSEALSRQLTEQAIAAREAGAGVDELGEGLGEGAKDAEDSAQASEAARKAAMDWLETEEAAIKLGDAFTSWQRHMALEWLETEEGTRAAAEATEEWVREEERRLEIIRQAVIKQAEYNMEIAKTEQAQADLTDIASQWSAWADSASTPAAMIAGAIPGLGKLQQGILKFVDGLDKTASGAITVKGAVQMIGTALKGVLAVLSLVVDAVKGIVDLFFGSAMAEIKSTILGLFDLFSIAQEAKEALGNVDPAAQGKTSLAKEADKIVQDRVDSTIAQIGAMLSATPAIIDAVIRELPKLWTAVVMAIPVVIMRLVDAMPALLQMVLDGALLLLNQSPQIFAALFSIGSTLVHFIVDHVDEITQAWIESLPLLIGALVAAAPEIIYAFTTMGPIIGFQIIMGMVAALPAFFENIAIGFMAVAQDFANAILDILTLGFSKALGIGFGRDGKQKGNGVPGWLDDTFGAVGDAWEGVFGRGRGRRGNRNMSGIGWVPQTMAAILEPGERVMNKDENARYSRGMHVSPPAPQPGRGGGAKLELVTVLDGRVVDATLVDGMGSGSMPRMRRAIKSSRAGHAVRTGFQRGRFNFWG